ncbi:DUF5343 domain-containing protein [Bradyrhizobium sp. LVM 105]|uniref:DUF5343 domain-containing protein n=1 Tax=Bradyrhizobium sp. LVM 105 TaxID=2341115 RepID=UPI000F805D0B|nr:DUF5343 domain-containing protein [Bradyrhizobium sp. LVM 105]RTE92033.1 hypothetical protein D6B98_16690 [Bradyrhizobium sp. LVM 105]
MPVQLPYLSSNKNVPVLFEKIATAKVPDSFTHAFLQNTIGLKNTNDRPLIPFLRNLGFIDSGNTPTPSYSLLKGSEKVRQTAIADGVRKAYGPLFDADEEAYTHTGEKLRNLISQVAGTDEDMTSRIASTFAAVAKLGDFKAEPTRKEDKKDPPPKDPDGEGEEQNGNGSRKVIKGLRTEFVYNIQVVLPSNASEETYLNIFNAIRKTFQ